ncbi:MAG TPA: ABC transporter permease [Mycobacteriales bacterium]
MASLTPVAAGTRVAGPPEGRPPDDRPLEDPARRGRRATPYLLLLPGLAWLVLFFAVPVFALGSTSLQTRVPGAEVGTYQQTYRWANYSDALTEYAPQFARSFLYAGLATVLALVIGYPLAYAIALRAGRWRNLLLIAVIAPFFTSFILRTIAWKQVLADEGPVVSTLRALHVLGPTTSLTASATAVVAGLTYNFLPFMVLPLYASLERLDPRLIEASGDLYAAAPVTFRRVTLPLSMPGVVAGTLLTFIPAAGDYVNAALLGNPSTSMIGNVVDSRFFRVVDYPTAASLSFVLMAAILVLVSVYIRRAGTEELV